MNLLEKYCIKSPEQLNLEEIANAEHIIIEPANTKSHLGRIAFGEEFGLIKISRDITEPGQRNFVIAHEMGHYFNERELLKNKNYHNCGIDDLSSFKSKKQAENKANDFAADLLMHKPWFSKFIVKRKINMELIKETAGHFNVSLTAAAIRYASIGKYPLAVIMSRDGKVVWNYINEYFPFKWIPNGYRVRKESAAYDFFAGNEVQTCEDLMPAYVWFGEDNRCRKEVYLYEQNLVMKNYKSVLTLLWESEYD